MGKGSQIGLKREHWERKRQTERLLTERVVESQARNEPKHAAFVVDELKQIKEAFVVVFRRDILFSFANERTPSVYSPKSEGRTSKTSSFSPLNHPPPHPVA